MNSETYHIRERFPDQKYSIDQLMAKDPEFLSLCDDYEPEAAIMIDEFRNIAQELEEEVVEALITVKIR